MQSIGFIGIGVMGKSMVKNLLKKGFTVSIYTRTKQKAEEVIAQGALWCDSIAECVSQKDVVITMVGYPKDVEEVYFGEKGILENAQKGSYVIDMTTTSPQLSEKIYQEGAKKGIATLDAPVSGSDIGAAQGTLSIMVGGDKEAFESCKNVFEALGKNIVYQGKAGCGQHTKMANQIALAGAISGVCEALTYGKAAGLDLQTMLDSISKGAAGSWQMDNMAPRILKQDFAPGFFIKHYVKDLNIATEEIQCRNIHLNVLQTVRSMYQSMENTGQGDFGTQALIKYYDTSVIEKRDTDE